MIVEASEARNLFDLEEVARARLDPETYDYLTGGSDDMRTTRANVDAFPQIGIRTRRLVDVTEVDTAVEVLGERWNTPIALAPVGFQAMFHEQGELETARAAATRQHRLIVSTVSSFGVDRIAEAGGPPWFQLYPTPDPEITRTLLRRAEDAGCTVVVFTVDVPVIGNREKGESKLNALLGEGHLSMGNFAGLRGGLTLDTPAVTWETVGWLRENCSMKILLKGIVTAEDAALAVEHGVDGLIVSNHGGRQEESDRSTMECLPEVVVASEGKLAVLIDGGIRRGTDVFKALALGADAVCIGRPFCWGLAAFGQSGVERVLELLQEELQRIMRLAGTTSIDRITAAFVTGTAGPPYPPHAG